MMRIHFEDLVVTATHGYYEHEWATPQSFSVSLSVMLEEIAVTNDDLGTTVDYDTLRTIVTEIFAGERVALIETLAEAIISKIREILPRGEISLTIRKLDAWESGVPGITLVSKG